MDPAHHLPAVLQKRKVVDSRCNMIRVHTNYNNKIIACGANTRLQLLIENAKLKKGYNYVKKT